MSLTYFPVTGILQAVITDTSTDVDGAPDLQYISCFVHFTPSVNQVYSTTDATLYKLAPIRARTNPDDGAIKNIDGTPVTLVANSTELDLDELTYLVTFSNVVYGGAEQVIQPFRFLAPTDTTPVDITTVDRIPT